MKILRALHSAAESLVEIQCTKIATDWFSIQITWNLLLLLFIQITSAGPLTPCCPQPPWCSAIFKSSHSAISLKNVFVAVKQQVSFPLCSGALKNWKLFPPLVPAQKKNLITPWISALPAANHPSRPRSLCRVRSFAGRTGWKQKILNYTRSELTQQKPTPQC